MISGVLEVLAFLFKCHTDSRNYNVSHHFPWMFPLAGILIVGGPGLLLALASRLAPRLVTTLAVLAVLLFVTLLGLLCRLPIYTVVSLPLAAVLAWRTAPLLAARVERFDRLVRRNLVVMSGLLVATIVACYGGDAWAEHRGLDHNSAGRGGPNVLLVVLDTVRATNLSLYGYERDTTPNLKRLAARGARFDRAFSTAPWTAPSHASMFTGRWCHELSVGWSRPLDKASPTLAGFLAAQGYATAGFVANTFYCSGETGLSRGFAHYEDYDVSLRAILLCSALVHRTLNFVGKYPELATRLALGDADPSSGHRARKDAARIVGDFLTWLDRLGRQDPGRPFFAFLNCYDAHLPYLAPEIGPALPLGRKPLSPADVTLLKSWWNHEKRRLSAAQVELARDGYDGCIAYLDHQLGRLFEELQRRGRLRDTLVIVTSDHGEHFGEQGLYCHGCSLYLPELQVPLLIFPPEEGAAAVGAGRVVTAPVSLRDLPATIVSMLGRSVQSTSPFPGHSLVPTWSSPPGSSPPPTSPVLSEIDTPAEGDPNQGSSPVCRGPLRSLVEGEFHYIRNGDGHEELYNLQDDPLETHDLAYSASADAATTLCRFRHSLQRAAPAAPRIAKPGTRDPAVLPAKHAE
jgi:arylsulfatase A-like enzyme